MEKNEEKNACYEWVNDVESWPNMWLVSFRSYEDDLAIFEVSERKDDRRAFLEFMETRVHALISFNGLSYDSPMLREAMRIIRKKPDWSVQQFCLYMKHFSDVIIFKDEYIQPDWPWDDIDVYLYWSKMIRMNRRLSLKGFAIHMNYDTVQELPYGPHAFILGDQFDKAVKYNAVHDTTITKMLALKLKRNIQLRREIKQRDGFNCLSWDDVKLGYYAIMRSYSEKTGIPEWKLTSKKYYAPIPDKPFLLDKIILPQISFEQNSARLSRMKVGGEWITTVYSPYGLLTMMKKLSIGKIAGGKEFKSARLITGNITLDVGKGGLHSVDRAEVIYPQSDERLVDVDFTSFYPHLMWKYGFTSRNYPNMHELIGDKIQHRIRIKKTDFSMSAFLKLQLNSGFGVMRDKYRTTYDMEAFYSVTINGQLILIKLLERLRQFSEPVSANTDGVTVRIKKSLMGRLKEEVKQFESDFLVPLEFDYYDKIMRLNVNNYIALRSDDSPELSKGRTKQKGLFVTDPVLENSCDYLIIPKALEAYFLNGTDPKDFIEAHNNKYDFCGSAKVDKKYKVWQGNTELPQRLNRYYPSTSGQLLYKVKQGKRNKMPDVPPVRLMNEPGELTDLDRSFFIKKVRRIIAEAETKETLF